MRKINYKYNFIICFFIFILFGLSSCVSSTGQSGSNESKEIWNGFVTGDIRGNMTLTLDKTQLQDNQRAINGKIVINYDFAKGGHDSGTMIGRIRGSLKNGNLDTKISGSVIGATFMGDITGPVSENRGSGTWSIYVPDEAAGTFTGNWQLEKIE